MIINTLMNLNHIFFLLKCPVPNNQTAGHYLESHSYISGNELTHFSLTIQNKQFNEQLKGHVLPLLIDPIILFPVFSSFTYRREVGYPIKLLLIIGTQFLPCKVSSYLVKFLFKGIQALIGPVRHYKTDPPHSESDKKALDVFFVSYTLLQKTIHFKLSFRELYSHYTEHSSNMAKLASS